MTNNTINNVPRELLRDIETHLDNIAEFDPTYAPYTVPLNTSAELLIPLRALLSAPSPAGVDGCKCSMSISMLGDGCRHCQPQEYIDRLGEMLDEERSELSDAQAIIDGLRAEVEALQSMITDLSKTGIRMRAERDNQARRAGELAAALEFACKSLAQVTSSDGSGHADIAVSVLRMAGRKEADASQIVEAYKAGAKWRIDAALSAGKEGE